MFTFFNFWSNWQKFILKVEKAGLKGKIVRKAILTNLDLNPQ